MLDRGLMWLLYMLARTGCILQLYRKTKEFANQVLKEKKQDDRNHMYLGRPAGRAFRHTEIPRTDKSPAQATKPSTNQINHTLRVRKTAIKFAAQGLPDNSDRCITDRSFRGIVGSER
jgi:hypothetical protein